ncbi:hypothetical protein F4779DRAFT_641097 [Xylariaceae sp. FL0662B]|nr:hypothetical protein F4779DRAFT_641097 [Xylariaceae sp. FL0662B]
MPAHSPLSVLAFGLLTRLDAATPKPAWVWYELIASMGSGLIMISDESLRTQFSGVRAYSFANQAYSIRDSYGPIAWSEVADVYIVSLGAICWLKLAVRLFTFFAVGAERDLELRKELKTEYGLEEKKRSSPRTASHKDSLTFCANSGTLERIPKSRVVILSLPMTNEPALRSTGYSVYATAPTPVTPRPVAGVEGENMPLSPSLPPDIKRALRSQQYVMLLCLMRRRPSHST